MICSLEDSLHQRANKLKEGRAPQYLVEDGLQKLQLVSSINALWKKFFNGGPEPTKDMDEDHATKAIKSAAGVAKNIEAMIQIAMDMDNLG